MRPLERCILGLAAVGLALTVVDVVGPRAPGWYAAGPAQTALHAGLAGVAALLLLVEGRARVAATRAVGIALLGFAALGTLTPGLLGTSRWHGLTLETLENGTHALLGAWCVWAARQPADA